MIHKIRQINGRIREILIFSIIFSIASMYPLLSTHNKPLYEAETNTVASYQHTASYNYTAELEYNRFYNNKTIITKNSGTLYTPIVKRLNISFDYDFMTNTKPENIKKNIQYIISIECEGKWRKTLSTEEIQTYFNFTENPFTMSLKIFNITKMFDRLINETGIGHSKRCIRIPP